MDERRLVERILQGEEKAKYEFYEAYKQKLYSFCVYTLGSNDPEIEDIPQEAFLAAFQKLPQFEFRSSLDTWLSQICLHQCYRYFRKRGRMVAQADEDLETLLNGRALDAAAKADRAKEQKERLEIVERALGKMGEPCRKVLELRSKQGASYIDIARTLKTPIGTVMSRLARCTEALKQEVERILKEGKK